MSSSSWLPAGPGITVPPIALASQYGFAEVGERWDEEDGLEIIYEAAASRYV